MFVMEERVIEKVQLCNSNRKCFVIEKINVLSGLVRDRKNKFLFVGEGNFSFTVAFNAYRQSLCSIHHSIFNDKDYPRSKIMSILLLVFQLTSSITDEAVERVCDLLQELQELQHQCMVPKSVNCAVKCLREMYLELLRANKCLTYTKMKSISRLAVKHLSRSIQKGIRANEYLLQSLKRAKDTEVMEYSSPLKYDIRFWNCEVKKCFTKVFGHCHFPPYSSDPFAELMKKDIDYLHTISLITADEIERDVNYFACPPIDIISSCYKKVI